MALVEESSQDLLQAYVDLWHQSLCYAKSLALAVALDLRIPDAIHHHGGGATLAQILAETALHPNKLRALRRLMRVLTVSGTFSVQQPSAGGDGHGSSVVDSSDEAVVYRLTAASRFLVSDEVSSESLAPFVSLALYPIAFSPHAGGICAWFRQEQNDPPAHDLAFCQTFSTFWEHSDDMNTVLHKGMVADSRFLMPIVLWECGEQVFRGVDSLVDVGGGHGGATAVIAAAFPHLKCSVLDLAHVVTGAPSGGNVQFIAGNMCLRVFHLQPLFSSRQFYTTGMNDECVKILKKCRQAISPRDAGGKIIILDMVVGYGQPDIKHLETQVMFDLYIMSLNGAERTEQEFKKIFAEAGFKDYKIITVVGALSVIELYP